mmetsp:Transcript_36330/g.114694  ORF Transcript_36330/g.114694 Transcript_36330/m.114694 type:complete len:98 (+) Transcript_36330:151-444(+)
MEALLSFQGPVPPHYREGRGEGGLPLPLPREAALGVIAQLNAAVLHGSNVSLLADKMGKNLGEGTDLSVIEKHVVVIKWLRYNITKLLFEVRPRPVA